MASVSRVPGRSRDNPAQVGLIRPMLATAGPLPGGPGWAYEFKWDGGRTVSYLEHDGVRAMSRNDLDVTASYPELTELVDLLAGHTAVLDGELVAYDDAGHPSFPVLQQRMHVRLPSDALLAAVPVHYQVFDLLGLDGASLLEHSYDQRRALLESAAAARAQRAPPPGVRRRAQATLQPLRRPTPPLADVPREHARRAIWVEPTLVGEVAYRTWTPDQRLRHASWRGLRTDKTPDEVHGPSSNARPADAIPAMSRATVVGSMHTPDGAWQVDIMQREDSQWYRVSHGGNVFDWLTVDALRRILHAAGIDLADLAEDA